MPKSLVKNPGLRGRAAAALVVAACLGLSSLAASVTDLTPSVSVTDLTPAAPAGSVACDPEVTRYIPDTPAVVAQLGMNQAWGLSTGEGAVVAVVDSGVSGNNAHLPESALLPGLDLVDPGDGRQDVYGHGTQVAGEIAARPVEGSGLVGLAPDAQILPVRVYATSSEEDQKAGRGPTPDHIATGIRWAADQGAQIIVVALSTSLDIPVLADAVSYAQSAGSLIVASAGNASDADTVEGQPRYPAGYPGVIGVGALDANGLPSDSSAHGPQVAISAPGVSVITTFFGAGDCMVSNEDPSTSFAAGYVAGIAALVASRYPDETSADWGYRLLVTASRPIAQTRDDSLGWGIISPVNALTFINDGTAFGPENPQFPVTPHYPPDYLPAPTIDEGTPVWVKTTVVFAFFVVLVVLAGALVIQHAPARRT